jgi:copper homeostasis protein (lipoprotein)
MTHFHIINKIIFLFLFASISLQAKEMTGMYSYMADAGLFLECGQKKRLPVAMEGDNVALERAYLKNHYMPGKSLLVTFEGHRAMRPKMEGDSQEEAVIVEKFLTIAQQERCTGIVPPSSLNNTYWKLVELGGKKLNENNVMLNTKQETYRAIRDLYFIIKQNDQLSGFSGCNKFSGRIIYDEDNMKIGPLMSTRMACPAMAIENQFHEQLNKVDYYAIKGESLMLFQSDPGGNKEVAKFIAIYF